MVDGKNVVVGMTGGIACYKACEVVRLLVGAGGSVRVVMTRGARQFVTPLTMQALSGHVVGTDVFSCSEEAEIGHIRLADEADVVLVAPATANVMAKMTHGIADDLLTTVLLATRAPVLAAPAMNVNMWSHAATRANAAVLRDRGVTLVGPDHGELACGWEGAGRMATPAAIVEAVARAVGPADLSDEHVLVSAGPTREAIDPVRFLSNRSTGRMGYAVARAAYRRGARVTLVSGPTDLASPYGVDVVRVGSADEMRAALTRAYRAASVLVMAAAVADYRPAAAATDKLKKAAAGRTLRLVRTTDIVSDLARRKGARLIVGFAAETRDLEAEGRRKLAEKHLDLIVANDVTAPGAGFEVDTNRVRLLDCSGGDVELPLLSKDAVADRILDWVARARSEAEARGPRRRRSTSPGRRGRRSRG
jgi:phosphopantothenoylcysteine decarboxylase/phosphopantothenate--cysteine ligase